MIRQRTLLSTFALLSLSVLFFLVGGCSSTPKENPAIGQLLENDVGDVDQELANEIMTTSTRSQSNFRKKVEGELHVKIRWWMRYFSVRERDRFKRNLERGESYRPLVQQILRESKLPVELYYLALIESGYVTHATSHANAVGIWQFMAPTAVHYGLGVNVNLDERRHPVAATEAAARYLAHLHDKFQSWYLAIAAYNAGEGRITTAMKKAKSRDFWYLAERGYLSRETMDYIPKFLAAATIGNHPENFGINVLRPINQWPAIAAVKVKQGTSLLSVTKKSGLSEKQFLKLNPQFHQKLSSSGKYIRIWVPKEALKNFS